VLHTNLLTQLFALAGAGYLAAFAIPLAVIDARHHRLPNRLVLPALLITLVGQLLAAALGAEGWRLPLALALASAAFGLGLVLSLRGFMGMGDTKLLTAMALALGWFSPLAFGLALLVSFGLAGAVALVATVLRGASLQTKMPLGPYLLAGHLAALVQVLTTEVVWSSTAR
jgi:leader peptidase (prepilin peptidase)/N-methyltransferase